LDDISAGRQCVEDLSSLPTSLEQIYHSFLARFGNAEWNDAYQPVFAALSVAQEPLTEDQLAHFADLSVTKVRKLLGVAIQFLTCTQTIEGQNGFVLFHQSLRDYLLSDDANADFWCPVEDAHKAIARFYLAHYSDRWGECDAYGLRDLLFHALNGGLAKEGAQLLEDFDWLQAKISIADSFDIIDDYKRTPLSEKGKRWALFLKENTHFLQRANTHWPANLILIQRATEHSMDSVVAEAARLWLEGAGREVIWVRRVYRGLHAFGTSGVLVFEGHKARLGGAVAMHDDLIASWTSEFAGYQYSDSENVIRLWDVTTGKTLGILPHYNFIKMAIRIDSEHLISSHWSSEHGTILWKWNVNTQEIKGEYLGHNGSADCIQLFSGNRVAASGSFRHEQQLTLWDLETGSLLSQIHGAAAGVKGAAGGINGVVELADGRVATWERHGSPHNFGIFKIAVWNLNSASPECLLDGHTSDVNGLLEYSAGTLISWSDDGTIRVWDLTDGRSIACLEAPHGSVGGGSKLAGRKVDLLDIVASEYLWPTGTQKTVLSVGYWSERTASCV
jgi:hypothetical protein